MSREQKTDGRAAQVQDTEGMLRHPDGSVDIAAYAKRAHRERAAAIAFSAREAIRMVREMVLGVHASRATGRKVRAGFRTASRSGPAISRVRQI